VTKLAAPTAGSVDEDVVHAQEDSSVRQPLIPLEAHAVRTSRVLAVVVALVVAFSTSLDLFVWKQKEL
jgi:hypothetical protein